jgi:glycosyltransferase involved in cell wall biosynthesis
MPDAIVYSGSSWESCNVMERLSIALTKLGTKVLYCDNPVSRLKGKPPEMQEIEPAIFRFRSALLGHRLNAFRPLAIVQSRIVANQFVRAAKKLHLRKPIFFYPYSGRLVPICAEMKRRGHILVHFCLDYPEPELREHVSPADLTCVIPLAALDPIRAIAGSRAILIPQLGPPEKKLGPSTGEPGLLERNPDGGIPNAIEPSALRNIARPRLIYAGAVQTRVLLPVVNEILRLRPQWHFVHFGSPDDLPLPNAHALPWMQRDELTQVIASSDVGFMPYDRSDPVQRNVFVPLKLLDYFRVGMPVVSTPIEGMLELREMVYTGGTVDELTEAVERALSEQADSSKRSRRKEFAEGHSLENFARLLSRILPING